MPDEAKKQPGVVEAAKKLAGRARDIATDLNGRLVASGITVANLVGDQTGWETWFCTQYTDVLAHHAGIDTVTAFHILSHLTSHAIDHTAQYLKGRSQTFADRPKLATVQIDLDGEDREAVLALGRQIVGRDLAEGGREDEPHVTVRYGFHDNDPAAVAKLVAENGPVRLKLGAIEAFTHDDADVLYVAVESPDLVRLNAVLGELPNSNDHPEYVPHATIAYLKPGRAADYVQMVPALDREIVADRLTFASGPDRAKTAIPLTGSSSQATAFAEGQAVEDVTALAGPDGQALAKVVRESARHGAEVLAELARIAVERLGTRNHPRRFKTLFTEAERGELAEALAAVTATADLLGRARVLELVDKAKSSGTRKFSDADPLRTFADTPPGVIAAPERALDYFRNLVPRLRQPGEGFIEAWRNRAFTLARSTDEELTRRVHAAIGQALASGQSTNQAVADVRAILEGAGVSPGRPSYSEMVFRTAAHSAYTTAAFSELQEPDVVESFPVWRYTNPVDSRSRPHHAARNGKYYPSSATFASVRGEGPEDVCNDRCNFVAIFRDDWKELMGQGARVESSW